MNNPPTLNIKVLSQKGVLFDGQALSISSINSQGPFDVLPNHANFITLIEKKPITVRLEKQKPLTFNFPIAIIYLSQNLIRIYTDLDV